MESSPHASQRLASLLSRLQAVLSERYTIERELGRGGMATVYLAQDRKHHRLVAIKVLKPELAAALGPERFLREIAIAARLQHPHILPLHDSGEAAGLLYYVMPYVEGESLRDRLSREGHLSLDEAIRITREVAGALSYAHSHEVVHRDIKPENILLSGDEAVVADFGIARALTAANRDSLTGTGVFIGTPGYMSPEQATGAGQVDGRSDIYSLGCVLHEMLAGHLPFAGSRAELPDAPETLHVVIAKAMASLPADRFPTATDFARALEGAAPRAHETTLQRLRTPLALAIGLGLLLGVGAVFARHLGSGAEVASAPAPTLLAVLPFENRGAAEDEYFADGMTDEVRGKLAAVRGLRLIARGSSAPYKKTLKTPQQIAQELGVNYLLTAVVRWEKAPGGQGRVHMIPELVEVNGRQAPVTRWQQLFDTPLTNVFQVQANIAGRVAEALNVALSDSAKHQLADRPTQNLPAYDAFLKGEAVSQGMSVRDPASLRQAITAYEEAVALDSTFVLAWAQLARAEVALYVTSVPTQARAETARRAAERARALAPSRPEGHEALAAYYTYIRTDFARALAEDSSALALAPDNAEFLSALAAVEEGLGRWDDARVHLEHAARLDPRSVNAARRLGFVLLWTHRYSDAQQIYDRGLQLAPANLVMLEYRALVALAQGDLPGARVILAEAPREIAPTALVAYMASYDDLMWVLDEPQQRLLLRLAPSAFDDDSVTRAMVFAQTYHLRGDQTRARMYADSARRALQRQVAAAPQDAQRHVFLGLMLAYLGRKGEAITEGERGVALSPVSKDPVAGPYYRHQLVRIYILIGEPEKALDELEPLLKTPYYLSPGWLRIDPNFAPLRDKPRFQRLRNGRT